MTTSAPVRFIVLGEGRTGSNLLVQALNGHPQVRCFGEVFNWTHARIDYGVAGYELRSLEDLGRRSKDPVGLLRERVWGEAPPGVRALGFKLHYGHTFGYAGVQEALTGDTELRVLHLRRTNLLRLFLSLKRAEATGVWKEDASPAPATPFGPRGLLAMARHPSSTIARLRARRLRQATAAAGAPGPMVLQLEECRDFFMRHILQAQQAEAAFAGHPTLPLTYEAIASDRDAVFASVERFLDVDVRPLSVTMQRQNTRGLRASLANYDELREAFAGTPHAGYFDD